MFDFAPEVTASNPPRWAIGLPSNPALGLAFVTFGKVLKVRGFALGLTLSWAEAGANSPCQLAAPVRTRTAMTFTHEQRRPVNDGHPSLHGATCDRCPKPGSSAGFSLIELLVVVAVVLVISAFAIPTLTTTMDSIRVRGALGSASNIVQRCRIQAIKRNVYQRLHVSAACGGQIVLFVTDGTDGSACPPVVVNPVLTVNPVSSQVWFPNEFSIPGTPTGAGAPPQLTTTQMWGTAGVKLHVNPDDPYFNSRGLPCWPGAGAACSSDGGFVYYYRYRSAGRTKWSATSISPAGRIESWIWNGTSWGN